jgi:hypothetical protein
MSDGDQMTYAMSSVGHCQLLYIRRLTSSLRFEALAEMNGKTAVFWQVTQSSLIEFFQRFEATYCLCLQVLNDVISQKIAVLHFGDVFDIDALYCVHLLTTAYVHIPS